MKRFFFSAIALMVAATACTESGLIDTPAFYKNAIVFDTYVGKNPETKALSVDETYLQQTSANGGGVHMYAFLKDTNTGIIDFANPYLDGELLYVDEAWGYYEDETLVDAYWPDGYRLAFAAYSLNAKKTLPDSREYISAISDNYEFDFTVMEATSEQIDLLAMAFSDNVATVNTTTGDTQVSLTFQHLLSRVGYSVYATSEGVWIDIKSIKLCGAFPKKGKVNLTSSPAAIQPITTGSNAYTYSYEFFGQNEYFHISSSDCSPAATDAAVISSNRSGTTPIDKSNDCYQMIMPGQVDDLYIEVTYTLDDGDDRYAKVDLGTWTFKAGYAYQFIFRIATAAIEFSATIVEGTDWTTPTPDEL